jgi:oligopeptide transport system ATP-binding protein
MDAEHQTILSIRDLSISFRTASGEVRAVRNVSLTLRKGETLAIVGESGSGKSVTVKAIMGILSSNGRIHSGAIDFAYRQDDQTVRRDLLTMTKQERRRIVSGKRIAMVFQDPMTSLNPTMSVGAQLTEGMRLHFKKTKKEAYARALELLNLVGIPEAEARMKNYPHQLSGGMRQRVVIAIALACNPDVLICDEPTTALDVTIQAKILELIQDIQRKLGLSVIYITHDLGVVAKVADYVAVMYAGKIVEQGTVNDVFYDARHPYTWGLLSAMPDLDTRNDELYTIPGSPPNMLGELIGDAFAPRNIYALHVDHRLEPPMFRISDTHSAATWLLHENAPKIDMPPELRNRVDRMLREHLDKGQGQTPSPEPIPGKEREGYGT